MSEHKYCIEHAVEFFPDRGIERTVKGRFKIVRLLLGEGNTPPQPPAGRVKLTVPAHVCAVAISENPVVSGISETPKSTYCSGFVWLGD
jgi:hypothetical protein